MEYTVKRLGELAGVSVRTLHYYDQIDLLKPAGVRANGYRVYSERELLRLQQIIFLRELDFELERIKRIFDSPRYDPLGALEDQRELLSLKRERLGKMVRLIDKTIKHMKDQRKEKVTEADLRACFEDGKYDAYKAEAEERWGADQINRSENIMKNMTKAELAALQAEGDAVNRELARVMDRGAGSPKAQAAIGRHYEYIIRFYDPSWPLLEIYRGLGDMYVDDPRFKANYDKYRPGLAEFLREAMNIFCDRKEE